MLADKELRGAMHGIDIQVLRHLPRAIAGKGERRAAIDNAIEIATPDTEKPGMPIIADDFAGIDRNGIGPQMRVYRLHQAERIDLLLNVDMAAHSQGMHACIGAPCAVQHSLFARDAANRFLDALLHAWAMLLPLEPLKRGAVKFDGESEAGQVSLVPGSTGLPRRKSSSSIAGLPAL